MGQGFASQFCRRRLTSTASVFGVEANSTSYSCHAVVPCGRGFDSASTRASSAPASATTKTGGPPVFTVADASAEDARVLAESKTLPQGTSAWQEYEVEFASTPKTEAVLVSLRRQNCDASPCPMFGRVWLDDFSLRKL